MAADLRLSISQLVRRLREQVEGNDLTKSQTAVLLRLESDGPATATALAHAQGMRPQSMAKIIHTLLDAGLIAGSPDPRDGRKTVLSLTRTAREQFRTGRRAREDWLTQAIDANLSPEEITQLSLSTHLLQRLAKSP